MRRSQRTAARSSDEVDVPSERQSSLRSRSLRASASPDKRNAHHNDPATTTKRSIYSEQATKDDEIEVQSSSKRKRQSEPPKSQQKSKKRKMTKAERRRDNLNHPETQEWNNGRITPSPEPEDVQDLGTGGDTSAQEEGNEAEAAQDGDQSQNESNGAPSNDNHSGASQQGNTTTNILSLPTEIIQQVMYHLPRDSDLVSFAAAGKAIYGTYTRSVTLLRFNKVFDELFEVLDLKKVKNETESDLIQRKLQVVEYQYQMRQSLPSRFLSFFSWGQKAEKAQACAIDVFQTMILNSNARIKRNDDGDEIVVGKNQQWLSDYFKLNSANAHQGTNLLDHIDAVRRGKYSPRGKWTTNQELAVKLCFAHFMLHPDVPQQMNSFHESQAEVYKCMRKAPLFRGKVGFEVDLQWLQHVANFFKFHFKAQQGQGLLTHVVEALEEKDRPRAWPGKLENKTKKLGPKWKGAFTYIGDDDQLLSLRNGQLEETAEDETSEDNDGFQDLKIFNDILEHKELHYPDVYEQELKSKPKGSYKDEKTRQIIVPEYKDFFGLGTAKTNYHLYGRMHSLPPQGGIPGWQRVTMMKEMPHQETGAYGPGLTQLWAYEGVVLPGGQIILGRWWSPFRNDVQGNSYCGPFIFWQVSSDLEKNSSAEALAFLREVANKTV